MQGTIEGIAVLLELHTLLLDDNLGLLLPQVVKLGCPDLLVEDDGLHIAHVGVLCAP